jgi:hypothetical protein
MHGQYENYVSTNPEFFWGIDIFFQLSPLGMIFHDWRATIASAITVMIKA